MPGWGGTLHRRAEQRALPKSDEQGQRKTRHDPHEQGPKYGRIGYQEPTYLQAIIKETLLFGHPLGTRVACVIQLQTSLNIFCDKKKYCKEHFVFNSII